jgi:ATP-dependent RNA helicase DeaD
VNPHQTDSYIEGQAKNILIKYDPQAIAAAALQMVYDQNCPPWMKTDWEVPQSGVPKPLIKRKNNRSNRKDGYKSKSVTENRSQGKIRSEVVISEQ